MAVGIFAGMMPIIPFHTATALALALFFKGNKIAAALGVWVSNPLNWYLLYYFNYKIGAFILGLSEKGIGFSSLLSSSSQGETAIDVAMKILGAGSLVVTAFLLGGLVMGGICAIPSYFIFLKVFRSMRHWREQRRKGSH